jgi:hypothetical protein
MLQGADGHHALDRTEVRRHQPSKGSHAALQDIAIPCTVFCSAASCTLGARHTRSEVIASVEAGADLLASTGEDRTGRGRVCPAAATPSTCSPVPTARSPRASRLT